MRKHYDLIVIGSGPAGLTAAKCAAECGRTAAVLERDSETSKKIYATGNGRCNFLNRKAEDADLVLEYCNSIGIVETEEDDGRLYPRSLQADFVAKALCAAAKKAGAEIFVEFTAKSVQKNDHGFEVESEDGEKLSSDCLIIATGGKAGIQFGCYGDGFKWAEQFGHKLVKPIPALTGLETAEDIEMLHGVRVKAKASILLNGKELASDSGEVQFTKNSVSGICVMNLSRYLRTGDGKEYTLILDLFPEYTEKELIQLFKKQKQITACAIEGLLPDKMHDYLHTRIKPNEHGPEKMADLSKKLSFTLTGSKGWKDAQVTSGGVSLDELTDEYESKIISGLFFAGEVVDYDGPCGGYNIGFAIKTGMITGKAAAK